MNTPYYQLLYIICFIFSSLVSLAQTQPAAQSKITGTLQNATTKAPVGFANVVLLTASDSSLVTGATTDQNGRFTLAPVPAGIYTIRISMLGFQNKFIPNVVVPANTPEVALGTVTLGTSATALEEVVVTTERELVEYDLDKRVVNVSKDINAQSGSVADVMQNVPSVTVDIDGNVSMRGSSSVTILIDGKRSALSNLTLDQIPANLIESVELITNPSAKYDPEGTSGIINLVLKKEKKPGFNGSASVTAGTYDNYNASVNLNFRYDKWSITGGYDFRQRTRPGSSKSFTTNFYEEEDSVSYRQQEGDRTSTDLSHSVRFGADYYLSPKHTISASTIYRTGQDEGTNTTWYRFLDEDRDLTNTRYRFTDEVEDEQAFDFTLGYRQTFDRKGQELTADFVYNTNVDDEISTFREVRALNAAPELEETLVDDDNKEIVAQVDYVHPFSEDSQLETGFRSTYEQLDEDSHYFKQDDAGNFIYDLKQSNHFIYDEQVFALYTNYNNKLGSFSYQLGLRAEQTLTDSEQLTDSSAFENNYFSLFPSIFITRDFNDDNKIQFSYSRRINRPRSRFLNPFEDLSDPFNVDFGNPELKPEYINSLELGYLRYWNNASFNSTVFYRHTSNEIERFRTPTTITIVDEQGIEQEVPANRTTFINLSSNASYGFEFSLNYPITNWWTVNGSLSGFRTQLSTTQSDTELSSAQFSWNTRANSTMTIWKDLSIQLSAYYRAPMADIQGRMDQMFSSDLALKKELFNEKASVSLRVSDIFNTRQFSFVSYGPAFRTEIENKRQSRIIYLGFNYRINKEGNKQRERERPQQEDGGDMEDDF